LVKILLEKKKEEIKPESVNQEDDTNKKDTEVSEKNNEETNQQVEENNRKEKYKPSNEQTEKRISKLCTVCGNHGTIHSAHPRSMNPFFRNLKGLKDRLQQEDWLCRTCYSQWHRRTYSRQTDDLNSKIEQEQPKKIALENCESCNSVVYKDDPTTECRNCEHIFHTSCITESNSIYMCETCRKSKPSVKQKSASKPVTRSKNSFPIDTPDLLDEYIQPERTKSPKKKYK